MAPPLSISNLRLPSEGLPATGRLPPGHGKAAFCHGVQRGLAVAADLVTSVQILAIGEGPYVSHCLLGGDIKAEIPCTPKSLNSLQLNSNSTEHRVSERITALRSHDPRSESGCLQVLTVGGSSPHIDLFTNLSYRAFSLSF